MNKLIEEANEDDLPEEVKAILAKGRRGRKNRLRHGYIFGCSMGIFFVPCMIWAGRTQNPFFEKMGYVASLSIFVAFLLNNGIQAKKGRYGIEEHDIDYLSSLEDKRVLRVLLSVPIFEQNKYLREKGIETIKHLLLRVTHEDVNLLTRRQIICLPALLNYSDNELRLAVFHALTQIGEKETIKELKSWKAISFGVRFPPEVLAAYKSCVAAIEARLAATRTDAQLLRPSSRLDSADTLLRPHTHKADEDAETLLRAGHGKDEDTEK